MISKTRVLFRTGCVLAASMAGLFAAATFADESGTSTAQVNLATMANVSSSFGGFRGGNSSAPSPINNGIDPVNSNDREHGALGGFRGGRGGRGGRGAAPEGTQTAWVQYNWSQPISTKEVGVYWLIGSGGQRGGGQRGGVRVLPPDQYRIKYWNGDEFVPVQNASGLGAQPDKYNTTTFAEAKTDRLRLEYDYEGTNGPPGILQWKVYDSGNSPNFTPVVVAGIDRNVIRGGKTYLNGSARDEGKPKPLINTWSKESGPGDVMFENAHAPVTTAKFATAGNYVLKLTADDGAVKTSETLKVKVEEPPPADRLDVVYTKNYRIDSPLWNARAKALIVNWIPHCIDQINRTDLTQGPGGIDNFVDAAAALRGEPLAEGHGHRGYVFANAWVHQTVESMCIALMVDPKGDPDIIKAQEKMRATLEDWIPKILAAQAPDGYLQTAFAMRRVSRLADGSYRYDNGPFERWSRRGDHEGYTAGYFIESAINHYTMTNGKDKRLYNAAKKLADCWADNLGPGKQEWFDGHQEMEQALVRFGRFVNDMEGPGHGDRYIKLAKFLLDCRSNGSEYDQSHVPVVQQYEAVGHAVRAVYNYSGMADVAAETHDVDYQSAVMSLWDNMVNRKYYITGGVGSGETSEGFGPDYSLRNNAYCESCSSCGLIFFQYKMNLAYHDAKYADLYEETMYNALLGATDLEGKNFYYTNPLIGGQRTPWHNCPCCVGNIPRTLLMIPTWTYVKGTDGIYVNLFIGSTIKVENVVGMNVEMVQKTDYPWSGKVAITVNPDQAKTFSVYVRVPNRTTSELYTPTPQVSGLTSLSVAGKPLTPKIEKGYAVITRTWNKGDTIELELPMAVQKVKASENIAADRGLVALRYGPLVYNVERADQPDINQPINPQAPLTTEWKGDLLDGVMVIKGRFADGSPLTAIPNYARNNRSGQSAASAAGDPAVDYSGASAYSGAATAGTTVAPAANTNLGAAVSVIAARSANASATNAVAGGEPGDRGRGTRGGSMVWLRAE